MRKLLGMSLSFCVRDILAGHVEVEEVTEIYPSTKGLLAEPTIEFTTIHTRGPGFDTIVDRYMNWYWREYPRDRVEELLDHLIKLEKIKERGPHGLSGSWVDATKPVHWGKVSVGNQHGVVGTYINVEDNTVYKTPDDVKLKEYQK